MQETLVRYSGWENFLEKGMATHSSILAWRIPWTEDPGGTQSMGSLQRVWQDWATNTLTWLPLKMQTLWDCTSSRGVSFSGLLGPGLISRMEVMRGIGGGLIGKEMDCPQNPLIKYPGPLTETRWGSGKMARKQTEGLPVVQWVRLHALNEGTWVLAQVRELDHHAATHSSHAKTKDPTCSN